LAAISRWLLGRRPVIGSSRGRRPWRRRGYQARRLGLAVHKHGRKAFPLKGRARGLASLLLRIISIAVSNSSSVTPRHLSTKLTSCLGRPAGFGLFPLGKGRPTTFFFGGGLLLSSSVMLISFRL